jgi:hypothetical protein
MNPTTVELLNQSAPLVDYNLFSSHSALVDALAAQAALLLQHGPEPSCEAFLGSRLTSGAPAAFGTLPLGVDCEALMTRVLAP